ncbi:MAG: DUF3991 and toprim domain-containing protein [Deltaproteobacteria bacterium]|jgi:hypothetical protein|nr:DUF3991 and toprim domain-containing protein [Deltaproteobacteria bacterium]
MTTHNYKSLREIDLSMVMLELFNAVEIDSKPSYATRKFRLGSKKNIATTGLKWIDNTDNKGGFGALDLVMHVTSKSLENAACILERFICQGTSDVIDRHIEQNNCSMPDPCKNTWLSVKNYLIKNRCIPEHVINTLHSESLIWSDKNRNCVFPRDLNSGAYLRGTLPGIPFKMTIGKNGRPYVIRGDKEIIITEAPIDAISLMCYFPAATILATGGRLGFDKIEPYLVRAKKAFLAQDNDNAGEQQANNLKRCIKIQTERLLPRHNLKDWNEVLIFEVGRLMH